MALRDFLRKLSARRIEKAKLLKDAQDQVNVSNMVEQRMKSPQERELEGFLEKKRQEQIKKEVEVFRAKEKREMFSGGLSPEKNIFKNHKNILGGKKLFPVKAQGHGGGMFFK